MTYGVKLLQNQVHASKTTNKVTRRTQNFGQFNETFSYHDQIIYKLATLLKMKNRWQKKIMLTSRKSDES